MNFTKGGDDISESSKELEENELKTLDWEAEIQGQVNHWCLCAEEEGIRSPLKIGDKISSKRVLFPILFLNEDTSAPPVVIGVVLAGVAGQYVIAGFSMNKLPEEIYKVVKKSFEIEGIMTVNEAGEDINHSSRAIVDVLLEHRRAMILLPNDLIFARQNGWDKLFDQVLSNHRSTNRVAVYKLGRMALWFQKDQKESYYKIRKENLLDFLNLRRDEDADL